MTRKKYIIGNWKLHKTTNDIKKFFIDFNKVFVKNKDIVCGFAPTAIYLTTALKARKQPTIEIICQDAGNELVGGFTGQISATQLKDLHINYAIVGHSETRQFLGCTDLDVGKKVINCVSNGIHPIICIGEKASQKHNPQKALGQQLKTIFRHVKPEQACQCIIAYEPIWAIGSGETPSLSRINQTTTFIRKTMKEMFNGIVANKVPVLYGGSVNNDNAKDILALKNVDGLLIGGASLDPKKIGKIIKELNVCLRRK